MKNNKLIQLLKTLQPAEILLFVDFVRSPLFNSNKKAIQLIEWLQAYYPQFDISEAEQQSVQQRLFPEAQSNAFAVLLHQVGNLFQDFLSWYGTHQQQEQRELALLRLLQQKGLKREFLKEYAHSWNSLTQSSYPLSLEQHRRQYERLLILQEFNVLQRDTTFVADLPSIAEHMHHYTIVQRLYWFCMMLNKSLLSDIALHQTEIANLLQQVGQSTALQADALIRLYFMLLQLLQAAHIQQEATVLDTQYAAVKEQIIACHHHIPTEELRDIYIFCINFALKRVRAGYSDYTQEAFQVYKWQLEKGTLLTNQYILPSNVYNIVVLGLKSGEKEWVKNFIELYRRSVSPEMQEDMYHFNKGVYYFLTQSYQQAIIELNKISSFISPLFAFEYKTLLLKAYYEQEEIMALESLVASFGAYVKNQKQIPAERRASYLNLIRFAHKLLKLNYAPRGNSEKLKKLSEEIHQCKNINERQWLLTKINTLLSDGG